MKSLLPMMTMILKVAPFYNGVATIAEIFEIPIPHIPDKVTKWLKEKKAFIKAGSNMKGNGLNDAINLKTIETKKVNGKETKVKGEALRDFERTLKEKDPDNTFCGMRRVSSFHQK